MSTVTETTVRDVAPPEGRGGASAWRAMPAVRRSAVAGAMVVLVAVAVAGRALADAGPALVVAADVAAGLVGLALLPRLVGGSLPAALAVAILGAVSPAATPLAATAVLWVARQRSTDVAMAVAGTSAVTMLVRGLWRPAAGIDLGWWVVLVVVLHAALLGWGIATRARHALVAELVQRARRAEAEQASRVAEARRLERTRLAREMHDVLAHRLSLLTTYAGALEYRADASEREVNDAATVIRSAAHQALEDLRDVITVLRDDGGTDSARRTPRGLADLEDLVAEGRRAGATIRFVDHLRDPDRRRIPARIGPTVYRVLQEALTNARKHAPHARVDIEITGRPGDRLHLIVTNAAPERSQTVRDDSGGGFGLVGLEERLHLVGGTLDHGRRTDGSFRVRASLPWPA